MSTGHVDTTIKTAVQNNTVVDAVLDATAILNWRNEIAAKIDGNYDEAHALVPLTGAGTPYGVITPTFVGQSYVDTTTGFRYTAYAISNVAWVMPSPYSNMTDQAIVNAAFEVWQQGTTFTNPANAIYTADMWFNSLGYTGTLPTTIIHSQVTLTSGELPNTKYAYNVNVNGAGSFSGAVDFYAQKQRIEFGTSKLCGIGKKITVSFYAKSNIAGKRIALSVQQIYGTGGSPSTSDTCTPTSTTIRTLTSNMSLYTCTFTTVTLAGKTFGTNNDDYLQVSINEMWGATYATNFLGGGTAENFVGAGDITFTEVVVNAGDTALPYQPKSLAQETIDCLRYYENSYATGVTVGTADGYDQMMGSLVAADTNSLLGLLSFKVRKRVNPVITLRAANVATGSGTLSNVRDDTVGGLLSVSGCTFLKSQWGIRRITLAASFVANHTYAFSWEADARL